MKKLYASFVLAILGMNLFATTPNYFIENKGQLNNEFSYYSKGKYRNLFFNENSFTYQFVKHLKEIRFDDINNEFIGEGRVKILNLQVKFLNANISNSIAGDEMIKGKVNYFKGKNEADWHTDLSCFNAIKYKETYKGIDLKYFFKENALEYDITVKPGAKIQNIKLEYLGADNLRISKTGDLIIETSLGTFTEKIPESYQIINGKKSLVKVKYKLLGKNKIGFESDKYLLNYPLVIDPTLAFSTYIGGSGDDLVFTGEIQRDNQGNTYMTGWSTSANFPTQAGSYDLTFNGGTHDGVLLKLSNNGSTLVYCTYLGGSNTDYVRSLVLDKATNEVVVVGDTYSNDLPSTSGAYKTTNQGAWDIFVTKFNAAGSSLLFSTYVGGPNADQPLSITMDNLKNIYVNGQAGPGWVTTGGCYQSAFGGNYDDIIFKLNATGTNLMYSTYIGGLGNDRGCGIDVDANHNIYISGFADDGTYPTTSGAFDQSYNGAWDMYISKFDSTLSSLKYSTYLGGSSNDWARTASIKVNTAGEVYCVGICGPGFPVTGGAYDNTYNGGVSDAFAFQLNNAGSNLIYSTFIGSAGDDGAHGMFMDSYRNVWLTGFCASGFPTTACSYDNSFNGGTMDGFFAWLNYNGSSLDYSSFLGGSSDEKGGGIVVSGDTVYVCGEVSSTDFPTTSGAFDQSYNGGTRDLFISKIINNGANLSITSNSIVCPGQSSTLTVSGASTYTWNTGSNSATIIVSPTVTTTYSVSGTNSLSCKGYSSVTITVGTSTPVTPSGISGPMYICSGATSGIYSVSPVNGATSYSWSLPGAWSGSSNTNAINTTFSGAGTMTVYAVNACGTSPGQTLAVNIAPTQTLTVNSNTTSGCGGIPITLSAFGSNTYSWSTGATVPTITVTQTTAGNYTYTVIGTSTAGCVDTKTVFLSFFGTPTITAVSSNSVICVGTSATLTANGGVTYTWSTGSNNSAILVSPTSSTNYTVSGTDLSGCTATIIFSEFVSPCSGINEATEANKNIAIYPNPVNGLLNVTIINESISLARIEIYDAIGRLILKESLTKETNVINVSKLENGIYTLKVYNNNKPVKTEKIIKQ